MIGGGVPLPEILGQTDSVGTKSPIFGLFSPVHMLSNESKMNVPKPPPLKGAAQKRSVRNLNHKLR